MHTCQLLYRQHFASFVDFAFRELYPDQKFMDNWHIQLIAEMLEISYYAQGQGANRMVFNAPPGYLKTHICAVSFPCWVLGRDPRLSVLLISETPEAALQLQEQCTELMGTVRYRSIFPRAKIRRAGRSLELEYGGSIRHAGIGCSLPHRKSDIVILDNPQSMHSLGRLELEPFHEIGRLLRNPQKGMMVLATRRLAEGDLSGFLGRQHGWKTLPIPVIALRDRELSLPPSFRHTVKRTDLLHEDLEEWADVWDRIEELGSERFCYQYLQGLYNPQPCGSILFTDVDGLKKQMIGHFDREYVAYRYLAELRREWEEKLLL